MADSNAVAVGPLAVLDRVPGLRQLLMLGALALSISAGVTAAFWAREPGMSLLFSNVADRDAGEMINVLSASGIPYELDRSSGALMVPSERVHEARLKLAGEGLPRGAGFGLEIIEGDTGFSTSQFMESARYHHALETELARTIGNLRPVQNARVHLALPKQTVFMRDRKAPSASVLVHLFPGRRLEEAQVASIVHLVASSIPDLESGAVTVVDQQGRLLTSPDGDTEMGLSTRQFEYVRRVEESYANRVVELLTPMLGPNRIRATVSAELDFTIREETRENYDPDSAVVRSEQTSEDRKLGGASGPGGIPGALSNQPPQAGPEAAQAQAAAESGEATSTSLNESLRRTRNYEVDRTLSRVVQPTGTVTRLSVAVLVDDRRVVDDKGNASTQPLTTTELEEVTRLVREAVGFDAARGDSVSVSNVSFFEETLPELEEPGFLDNPSMRGLLRQGLWAVLLIALALGVTRPIVRSLSVGLTGTAVAPAATPAGYGAIGAPAQERAPLNFEDKVTVARQLTDRNPERVAQIVRGWVQTDG